jgi:hypothetical protein
MFGEKKRSAEDIRKALANKGFKDFLLVGREFKYLAKVLSDSEEPLAAVSGVVKGNTVLCVLTTQQIYFIDHGLVYGVKTSTIPVQKINAVSYQSHLMWSAIEITNGANVTLIKNVPHSAAGKFVKVVNKYLATLTKNSSKEPQKASGTSVADELFKLKSLLDEGIINQKEFNSQKAKLLNKN